ncbi:hypothetical protein FB451DRAFT_1409882 [Mycena latifolia]|nr:hypothetical protein FB451DRAFT_1409882 [Mycena latifolia]
MDELGDNAHVLWIGPKRVERVLFFWDCYFLPVPHSILPFGDTFNDSGLQFLCDAGARPENLDVAGDSAGGNLVLQILSNMLNPHEDVPQIRPTGHFQSPGLFSPWLSLTAGTKSFQQSNGIDFLDRRILRAYGVGLLEGYSKADSAFAELAKTPQDWFEGVGGLVDHIIFITAGEREVMHDDIISVAERLKTHHKNVELVGQEDGVYDYMFIDFFTREKLDSLTPKVISWLSG